MPVARLAVPQRLPVIDTLVMAVFAIAVLSLAMLTFGAISRPPWTDELLGLVNYPLRSPLDLFRPLPLYSQAAPPLFNTFMSVLVHLPLELARLALMLVIVAGLGRCAYKVHPHATTVLFTLIFFSYFVKLTLGVTELKFYGLECLGAGVLAAWYLNKSSRAAFGPADCLIVATGIACGISTLILGGVCVTLYAVGALISRRRLSVRELGWLALLGVFIAGYYLLIGAITAIQMQNFPDAYGGSGIDAARYYVAAVADLAKMPIALVLSAFAAVALCGLVSDGMRKATLLLTTTFVLAGALAMAGMYPVTSAKKLLWLAALLLFVSLEIFVVVRAAWQTMQPGFRATMLALLLPLMALQLHYDLKVVSLGRRAYLSEDSEGLVRWLRAQPPGSIALWTAAQPLVDYYSRSYPELERQRYIAWADPRSAKVPAHLLAADFLRQPSHTIERYLEAQRDQPGAYDRRVINRLRNDYSGPAATLAANLPTGVSRVAAFHLDYAEDGRNPRVAPLLAMLDRRGCRHDPELKLLRAFVLKVSCPTAAGTT